MLLADCHTHTLCSPDSSAPLAQMVQGAEAAGVSILCTTDHCDLQGENGSHLEVWDWSPVLAQYRQACGEAPKGVELLLGLELGGAPWWAEQAREIVSQAPLDYVLGSIHTQSPQLGGRDFYFLDYPTEEFCRRALEDYLTSLSALAGLEGCYDVMAHIPYPMRYIGQRTSFPVSLWDYRDRLEEILRTLIQSGRGMELNTDRARGLDQWLPLLRLYRQLGGEIVTLGSDAHRAEDVGLGIREGCELLREAGFSRYTVFSGRRPRWIAL